MDALRHPEPDDGPLTVGFSVREKTQGEGDADRCYLLPEAVGACFQDHWVDNWEPLGQSGREKENGRRKWEVSLGAQRVYSAGSQKGQKLELRGHAPNSNITGILA